MHMDHTQPDYRPDYIVWRITETEDELKAALQHPDYYADKVQNLKPDSRRLLEVLAVRRALKELYDGEEQRVLYTADGKPYLEAGRYRISISHTQGYAAVIRSEAGCPGIDIERLGNRVERVVGQFLKPEENLLLQLSGDDYRTALHLAWSAKETAYKVLGHDYYDLKTLTTVMHVDWQGECLYLSVKGRETAMQIHFCLHPDYVLTWTVDS